ncbi:DUF397 domain-containing protein [Actinomadura sp. K4S16]|nr:DUF397 domain-containing protein [Actinomadura sp. K4S16]
MRTSDGESPVWRKSSRSTQGTSEQCVELAHLHQVIAIRDGKDAGHITLASDAFADILARAKPDELAL